MNMKINRLYFFLILLILNCNCLIISAQQLQSEMDLSVYSKGTENERTDFYDELYAKTMIREAWSPVKWEALGTDFETECSRLNLRQEFADADSDLKLLRAIHKFNYARKDRHLRLKATREYMDEDRIDQAPIRFYPDLSDETIVKFFVANLSQHVQDLGVERGDILLSVNGISIDKYIDLLSVYLRYSTYRHMLIMEAPKYISARSDIFGPELQQSDKVLFTLKRNSNGESYDITLNYSNPGSIAWLYKPILERDREDNLVDELYYEKFYSQFGFEQIFDDHLNSALYVNHNKKLALIEWYHFEETREGVEDLISAAQLNGVLGYDLIVDATHSGGGGNSALFLQVLSSTSFKTTFGNVRVTDNEFAQANAQRYNSSVKKWIMDAINSGQDYTDNEPFKLRLFPRGSNGIMKPAKSRFYGKIVVMFFTQGGSNLDQFAAMIADNPQLNIHTIGMPTGGYSNTWEWGEDIELPNGSTIEFEWDVGHTIRPNGEILEGNPAIPQEIIPFTSDNYETYFYDLILKCFDYLGRTTDIQSVSSKDVISDFKINNPISDLGLISFSLERNDYVDLKIFDISGREIATLIQGNLTDGPHKINWTPKELSIGTYIVRLRSGNIIKTIKFINCL